MASVFGKKDETVAKSWSDMFEEDEEEFEREADLESRREQNSRSWSDDGHKRLPVPPGVLTESKSRSSSNARLTPRPTSPIKASHGCNENDPFGSRARTPRLSPTQVPVDKWAALGHKRRNAAAETDNASQAWSAKKRSFTTGSRKRPTTGAGLDPAWHRRDSRTKAPRPAYLAQDWRQAKLTDSFADEDDHEWVGGWHNFHL